MGPALLSSLSENTLQQKLKEEVVSQEDKAAKSWLRVPPDLRPIRWLLSICCKKWGIMALATCLDLQGALKLAKSPQLKYLLINAGARPRQTFDGPWQGACAYGGAWAAAATDMSPQMLDFLFQPLEL